MFRLKKLDRLIITSFLPPFVVAMMIAVFVLLMQTLWLYIDEIAGKGLNFFIVVELLAYKCVSLVPLALPIAILIASVMVMGNLAERYELSSFKSAGVPLLRIMRPLMVAGFMAGLLSYYCSNYLIPVANLKFGSRMYDISRQKPALRLDAGVFNYDFQGYAIHIGSKGGDGKSIEDILIYDHSQANSQEFSQIIAESGEMYASGDGQFFIMNLHNGHQYIETRPSSNSKESPFVRTSFSEWNKVFDLSEFQLSRTDEELFKSNRSMLTISQLKEAVDSIGKQIRKREVNLSNHFGNYFTFLPHDSTFFEERLRDTTNSMDFTPSFLEDERERLEAEQEAQDSTGDGAASDTSLAEVILTRPDSILPAPVKVAQKTVNQPPAVPPATAAVRRQYGGRILDQKIEGPLDSLTSLLETWNATDRRRISNKTKTSLRSIQNQAESALRYLADLREDRVEHIYDMHTKYSMAVVCFIFILIGSPMGAIVRKGGFGYPILISIIFFMLFVVLTIFCRKVAEGLVLPAVAAAWIPNSVMLPIGIILTRKGMNDSKMLSFGRLGAFLAKVFRKKDKKAKA